MFIEMAIKRVWPSCVHLIYKSDSNNFNLKLGSFAVFGVRSPIIFYPIHAFKLRIIKPNNDTVMDNIFEN